MVRMLVIKYICVAQVCQIIASEVQMCQCCALSADIFSVDESVHRDVWSL